LNDLGSRISLTSLGEKQGEMWDGPRIFIFCTWLYLFYSHEEGLSPSCVWVKEQFQGHSPETWWIYIEFWMRVKRFFVFYWKFFESSWESLASCKDIEKNRGVCLLVFLSLKSLNFSLFFYLIEHKIIRSS
jgi:hypothetical protein